MKKTKVVCLGEALIDRISNKSNEKFTDFLGGAPANVACALRKLNIDSIFVGRLGDDEFGKKFIQKFNELEVNLQFLQLDKNFPTRVIRVNRDNSGDRYFSGFEASPNTVFADEVIAKYLDKESLSNLERIWIETKYFVTGSNILSSSISADSMYFLLKIALKFDVKVIIDLNWREVFWDYSSSSSKLSKQKRIKLVQELLNHAHLLKLAKDEAILFFGNVNPRAISKKFFNRPDVLITDGSHPITWYINGLEGKTKIFNSSKVIDTTGAGDAFLAGFISQLILSGYPTNLMEVQNCVRFASVCGFLTCLGEGAIEQQPDYGKVKEFLGSQIL